MDLAVGAIVEGKVTGITKFGAFVALPEASRVWCIFGGRFDFVMTSRISCRRASRSR